MSWKPAFMFHNDDKPHTNAQAFATQPEALGSAHARFMVWTMPTDYLAIESDEPVNYARIDGKDVMLDIGGAAGATMRIVSPEVTA